MQTVKLNDNAHELYSREPVKRDCTSTVAFLTAENQSSMTVGNPSSMTPAVHLFCSQRKIS